MKPSLDHWLVIDTYNKRLVGNQSGHKFIPFMQGINELCNLATGAELQAMADKKVTEAKLLIKEGHFEGGHYLSG